MREFDPVLFQIKRTFKRFHNVDEMRNSMAEVWENGKYV